MIDGSIAPYANLFPTDGKRVGVILLLSKMKNVQK